MYEGIQLRVRAHFSFCQLLIFLSQCFLSLIISCFYVFLFLVFNFLRYFGTLVSFVYSAYILVSFILRIVSESLQLMDDDHPSFLCVKRVFELCAMCCCFNCAQTILWSWSIHLASAIFSLVFHLPWSGLILICLWFNLFYFISSTPYINYYLSYQIILLYISVL